MYVQVTGICSGDRCMLRRQVYAWVMGVCIGDRCMFGRQVYV